MGTSAGTWRRDRLWASSATVLLVCGVIAGPLFVAVVVVEGATRPDYHPLRNSVSSLSLTGLGWMQSLDFIIAGLLTLAFAVGVRQALRPQQASVWGPLLIALWGIGLIVSGLFATDPDSGYPPGAPILDHPTVHGLLHDISVAFGFPALLAAFFVFVRRFAVRGERGWALSCAVGGVAFMISFFIAFRALGRTDGLGELGGLFERMAAVVGFSWLTALAVHLLTASRKNRVASDA
jgi:Protein of unknown function (DUF998)